MRVLAALLLSVSASWATTRHAPAEYATVQAALDAVQDGDTVLVAVGRYIEALQAPQRSFLL